MLDFIADRADLIIAAVQTALTLDMLPTIWTQFRARASTVPLTSSIPTAVGLAVLGLVFFATGLYIATVTVLVGSAVWAVVAAQRIVFSPGVEYNREHELCKDEKLSQKEIGADERKVSRTFSNCCRSEDAIERDEEALGESDLQSTDERSSQGKAQS